MPLGLIFGLVRMGAACAEGVGKAIKNGTKAALMNAAQRKAFLEEQRRLARIEERRDARNALIVLAIMFLLPVFLAFLFLSIIQ